MLASLFLREEMNMGKLLGLLRNVVVVVLVIDPLGFFALQGTAMNSDAAESAGGSGHSSNLLGLLWGVLSCLGAVFMRILQRNLSGKVSPAVMATYCFVIVTTL